MSAAFKAGHDVVRPVRPSTIAKSLAIGNPADGPYVLDTVRRTGGAVEDVSDEEVVEGIRLLARTEGIFAETAGGVTVATLRKLLAAGQLDPEAETVVFNTGDGLKTLDAVAPRRRPGRDDPGLGGRVHRRRPRLRAPPSRAGASPSGSRAMRRPGGRLRAPRSRHRPMSRICPAGVTAPLRCRSVEPRRLGTSTTRGRATCVVLSAQHQE